LAVFRRLVCAGDLIKLFVEDLMCRRNRLFFRVEGVLELAVNVECPMSDSSDAHLQCATDNGNAIRAGDGQLAVGVSAVFRIQHRFVPGIQNGRDSVQAD
jgi:hypothetical protein